MRAKYLTAIVVLLFLLVGISREARAQDEVPGPDLNSVSTQDPSADGEKPLIDESEGRTSKPVATDSAQTRAPAIAPVKKAAPQLDLKKPKDEDPLNFNFLFYIIQTFKSSDLMMED